MSNVTNDEIVTENPFLSARRKWNTHVGSILQEKKIWKAVAITSLCVTTLAVAGLIYTSQQLKYIPLVFERDKTGNVLSMTRADKVMVAKEADFRLTAIQFIHNLRLVSTDVQVQRKAITSVFDFLNDSDPAYAKIRGFYDGNNKNGQLNNPIARYLTYKEIADIEITSVIAQSKDTWQVDWIENTRNLDGAIKNKPIKMRASLTLYQANDSFAGSEALALKNPHFIYVKDIYFTQLF